jgi:hypothetical protein
MAPGIFSTSPFSTSPLPSTYQTHSTTAEQLDEYDLDSEDLLEPIAVVGLSLKFPDDATTPESFWKLLLEKRCASRDMPEDRANMEAFYHYDGSRPDAVSWSILFILFLFLKIFSVVRCTRRSFC